MSGNPVDIDALHQRISQLEQHNRDLQQQLDECDDDLAAARAANRELMARLNTPSRQR
jgi:phage shock protein A